MATDSPLVSHGHCTASVDLSSSAGLSGPGGSGQYLFVKISGSRTIALATDDVTSGDFSLLHGVLQNKPAAGEVAQVGVFGVTKVVAGAVFAAGTGLMNDTVGRAIPCPNSSPFGGQALEASQAAGHIVSILIAPIMGSGTPDPD